MSFSINQIPTLQALFKQVYADEVVNTIPERELLLRSVPFVSSEKQNGGDYNQPVILSRNHGVTYLGSNDDNLQINPAVAAIVKNATIRGSGMLLSGLLSYMAASRAVKGGPAFVDATSYLVEGLTDSFSAVHEQTMFAGQSGLASTVSASTEFSSNTWTVNPLVFAQAFWVGAEGMELDVYSSAAAYKTTVKVASVDLTANTITFDSLTSWTYAQGDVVYRKQAYGLEAQGLESIFGTSGTVFGINNSTYGLWKASTYAVNTSNTAALSGNYLSYQQVANGIAIAYSRGLEGEMDLHVNPRVFAGIIPDFLTSKNGAGSTFDGRYFTDASEVEKLKHGSKAIQFIINNVTVNLIANDYVKGGLAFGLAPTTLLRVGSSEMTFDLPGSSDSPAYFRSLDNYAALELRMFSDQAMFCKAPAKNILFTSIRVV